MVSMAFDSFIGIVVLNPAPDISGRKCGAYIDEFSDIRGECIKDSRSELEVLFKDLILG